LTLVLLGYFLGGHPQAWAFVHSSSHLIILQYLQLKTLYKTKHNSISNISVSIIMNQPFWFRFQPKTTTYKVYTTVATSPKVPWSKELKKKGDKAANTNIGRNLSKPNS
jgi:hypothetical protein